MRISYYLTIKKGDSIGYNSILDMGKSNLAMENPPFSSMIFPLRPQKCVSLKTRYHKT
jgi:hypothetical protein